MRERSNGVDARGGARFGVDMRDDFGHHPRGRDDARRSTRAHRVSLGVSSRVGIDAHAVQNARFTRSSRSRATRRRRRSAATSSPPLAILPENITSGPIRSLETTSSTEDANPPKMEDANPPKTSPPPSLSPSARASSYSTSTSSPDDRGRAPPAFVSPPIQSAVRGVARKSIVLWRVRDSIGPNTPASARRRPRVFERRWLERPRERISPSYDP